MIAAKKFNKRGIVANKFLYIDELKNFWLILELCTIDKMPQFVVVFMYSHIIYKRYKIV